MASASDSLRLLLAARYGALGASSRLRLAQYRPFLEAAGIRTTLRPFLSDGYIRALYGKSSRLPHIAAAYMRAPGVAIAARRSDVLWIEKEMLPWLPYAVERQAIGDRPYILDFDDAWSLRYEQSRFALVRRMLGEKFTQLVQGAALTITANETLYAWAQAQGARRLLMLPTVVDLDHYPLTSEPAREFTVGWVGTPLTAAYLQVVAAPLRRLAEEAPLKLLIVGAPEATLPGVACEHLPWSEVTEAASIARCHVGIMPLPDDEWARGKSGYKLIQYMAIGRPAVGSAIGANRQIIEHGVSGFLPRSDEDWVRQLRHLRDDAVLRQSMGAAARARVAENYSVQVTAPKLIAEIRAIAT
jgi:glycosyltransferase involved in cell wall biosynthesis